MTRARDLSDYGSRAGLAQIRPSSVAVGSGSATVADSGLVTTSAVSSVSLNGIFTSTYENYQIIINYTNATSSILDMRLRTSGSDATGATDYGSWGFYGVSNAGTLTGDSRNGSSWIVGYATNTIETSRVVTTIFSPQNSSRRTLFGSNCSYYDNTNFVTNSYSGGHKQITSYDGFTLFQTSGGTITGNIAVYGYKK